MSRQSKGSTLRWWLARLVGRRAALAVLPFPVPPFGPYLHVYGQSAPGEDVVLVGDRWALALLRDAINVALAERRADVENAQATDGKEYDIKVLCAGNGAMHLNLFPLPYADADVDVGRWQFLGAALRAYTVDDADTAPQEDGAEPGQGSPLDSTGKGGQSAPA